MKIKLLVSTLVLVIMLILGNANYHLAAQTPAKTMNLAFMAVPQKLIEDTDATLLVYAVDSNNTAVTVKIPSLAVTSSDPSAVSIKDISSEFDNSVKINIHAGKIGSATVTAVASGFLSSQVKLDVVGDAYKPAGLLVKAVPSKFSQSGPYRGYVSVQLVNFFGNPVAADEDLVINLSSSDPDVVSLNDKVTIKQGEYLVYREFTVLGPGTALLQAEVPDKWKESAQVTVTAPAGPLQIALKVLPNTAPALHLGKVYAFAQLQDASGNPVKANRDISVNIISDSFDILGGTGVIKKGETHTVAMLRVNTDTPNPSITLTAVAKGYRSSSASVQLVNAINQDSITPAIHIKPGTTFFNVGVKVVPIVYSIPVLADGNDQVIGVVQLEATGSSTSPVIATTDVRLAMESSDSDILQIKNGKVERYSSTSLIEAKMGYKAGQPSLVATADFFGESATTLTVLGHGGVTLASEPLISKVLPNSAFPIAVYFKDNNGTSSYSLKDMPISISKVDKPNGVNGSSTEILEISSGTVSKGSSIMLLQANSKGEGTSAVTFTASANDATFSTQTSITMNSQVPRSLDMFIPSLILGNAKYTIPLEVIDKDGFPVKTTSDVEVLLVSSASNVVSSQASVIIPKGQYYTTLLIEAAEQGQTEVTALANNFQSTKLNVKVTLAKPNLVLTPSSTIVTSAAVQSANQPVTEPQEQKSGNVILTMITSNPYFFALPAIGAVIFWLVKTERLNLPIGKLFERFRKSEE